MEGMRSNNMITISNFNQLSLKEIFEQIVLRVKYFIAKNFRGTFFDPFLPGLNGSSNVNNLFPIGQYSANLLEKITQKKNSHTENWLTKI